MKKFILSTLLTTFLTNCSMPAKRGYNFNEGVDMLFNKPTSKSEILKTLGEPTFYSIDGKRLYYTQINGIYNNTLRFKAKNFDILGFECYNGMCKKTIYENRTYE